MSGLRHRDGSEFRRKGRTDKGVLRCVGGHGGDTRVVVRRDGLRRGRGWWGTGVVVPGPEEGCVGLDWKGVRRRGGVRSDEGP